MTSPLTPALGVRVRRATAALLAPRRIITAIGLVFAWCALWGNVSIANVLSGTLIGFVVSAPSIATAGTGSVRLKPLLRFSYLVAIDLVISTLSVAREVLTPNDYTDEAIIAVRTESARGHHLLLNAAITVTPGTAVIDTDPDSGTLYIHVLHADRLDATVAHVNELAQLASEALPTTRSAGPAGSRL